MTSSFSPAALSYLAYKHRDTTPKTCRVCGSALAVAQAGGGEATVYVCASDEASYLGKDGQARDDAYNHRQASKVSSAYNGDPQILALITELHAIHSAQEDMSVPVGAEYYPYGHENGQCGVRFTHLGNDLWENTNDWDYTHDPTHSPYASTP